MDLYLIHSEKVWFEDGNCVLVAENVAFKVFLGIIEKISTAFAGMSTLPQPADGENAMTYAGCPVIRMEDSANEMTRFLQAIFDPQ